MAKRTIRPEWEKRPRRWRDLLATLPLPLSPGQRRALAAVAAGLRSRDPHLAQQLEGLPHFDHRAAVRVARTLRLETLTQGNMALTRALQRRLADETQGTLRPLAALRPDEWLELAFEHGTPDGTTPASYADALAAGVTQAKQKRR